MILCIPYDIEQIFAFFCSRYGNITYKELLNMGYEEFVAKINSLPKSEPLYEILKSRIIDISKIKDKEEKKYWLELKRINKIPDEYKTIEEVHREIKNMARKNGGIKNGNKIR
jgi:predicted RNA-binding protein with PUA domain